MVFPQEVLKIPDVLIIGEGPTAEATAEALGDLGYAVLPSKGTLLRIEGFAGDFEVTFRRKNAVRPSFPVEGKAEEEETVQAGAIVFAPELEPEGRFEDYRLRPSEQIITLEGLLPLFPPAALTCESGSSEPPYGLIKGNTEGRAKDLTPRSYIAFLLGIYNEGNVSDMHKALHLALAIRRTYQSQVYIFCRNVKVAEEGLERLYQTCREEGVIFFKGDSEGPELRPTGDRLALHFTDAVLGQPFALTPDLLVIDSVHRLPEEVRETALSTAIGLDKTGYLQPANVHLLPQASQREGIFVVGPGKGPIPPMNCLEEARAAALSVHHFFQGRTGDLMDREVSVDKGLCTTCLTCLRFCPHRAIGWTHRIFIHPLACRRCGICASECPMDAIQIAGYSDQEVDTFLRTLQSKWRQEKSQGPRVVLFGCSRSAGAAWKEIQGTGFKVQGAVAFMALPCAGKLDPDYLLKALSMGADGVLVLACPEENCKSIHGNTYARERIREAQDYIAEAGLQPERIRFEQVSSNQIWKFKEIIREFMGEQGQGLSLS